MSTALSPQLQLAQQYERQGRFEEAAALVRGAADAGDPHAQYVIAARLIGSGHAERARAVALVRTAAEQGHPQALHLWAVMAAAGFAQPQDWRAALDFLAQAAARGDGRARGQIALLGTPENVDIAQWLSPPQPRMQFTQPRVGIIEGFLSPQTCDWVVGAAKVMRLQRAQIVDPQTGIWSLHPGRTNSNIYLNLLQADIVVRLIKARIAASLGLPVTHQEDATVLRYDVGQVFEQHVDFLDPAEQGYTKELATFGQRTATFLIYLNDDFEGGETAFPALDWRYRGSKGDALFFWNVSPEGAVERRLVHAGRPPTRGEKWLFSQWVRDRPVEGAEPPVSGAAT